MVEAKQSHPSKARLGSPKGVGMGATAGKQRANKAVECVGFASSKRSAVLAARPAQRQVATGQEKQDDTTLSATGRSKWELLLTYPVPPVAGVVALTLRHEVIHHGGTSLSASAQGSMLKSWTVSSRVRHDLHVAKAALKNRPLRLLGLVVGRVVLYTPVVSPSGLVVG